MDDGTTARGTSLPTDRTGIEVLSFLQCEQELERSAIGRMAMVVRGEPVVLPVNYKYVNGCVVFRSAAGEKTGTAAMERPVAFEIDDYDTATCTGWSVLVKGTAELIDDDDPMALAAASLRPWATATERNIWIRIVPNEITGRRI
jgi:nitroimidazol reductase NimA-like FMN-containing flavoprotein (pyridoxamine 5'-phosphate oxidase superfamily)